jgi:ABC-2 type transport system permease protein
MILGFLVGFLLSAAVTSVAFWTTRVYSINDFYYALKLLFSGLFVPLTLMPKIVQTIAQYLPYQLQIYFPIQLILGKLSPAQIIQGYVSGIVWLLVAVTVFNLIWRNGIKRYSAVGA